MFTILLFGAGVLVSQVSSASCIVCADPDLVDGKCDLNTLMCNAEADEDKRDCNRYFSIMESCLPE